VTISDGAELVGTALLARRRRGPLSELALLGHGQSDYLRLPVVDTAGAAEKLAEGVANVVHAQRRPWRLRLEQLPVDDPTLRAIGTRLGVDVYDGDGAPWIPIVPGTDPEQSLPRSTRARARKARNRLNRERRNLSFEIERSAKPIDRLLGAIEDLHHKRDHAVRAHSELDDPEHRSFWQATVRQCAAKGNLEVAIARIDHEIAAYNIALLDGPAYRIWNARINPSYSRYAPGHLIRSELLPRLAAEGRFTVWDWMRGEEEYKMATTTHVAPTSKLCAWSPSWLASADRLRSSVIEIARRRWVSNSRS
jgi:CelD/BcsL family acetyltransferase involved in cellulose biosynthesis